MSNRIIFNTEGRKHRAFFMDYIKKRCASISQCLRVKFLEGCKGKDDKQSLSRTC